MALSWVGSFSSFHFASWHLILTVRYIWYTLLDSNFISKTIFLCTYFLFDIIGNQKQTEKNSRASKMFLRLTKMLWSSSDNKYFKNGCFVYRHSFIVDFAKSCWDIENFFFLKLFFREESLFLRVTFRILYHLH